MSTLVFDIEANGWVDTATKIHCICTENLDTGEIEAYYQDSLEEGIDALSVADKIVGHNIISYDLPLLKRLYPKWTFNSFDDTFILSCILFPLRQLHSIESYSEGYKVSNEDWSCLTLNMLDRCIIDTKVATNLYKKELKILSTTSDYDAAIQMEYEVLKNHQRQVKAGVDINLELVQSHIEYLDCELNRLKNTIDKKLPYRMLVDKNQYKKFFNKDGSIKSFVLSYLKGDTIDGNTNEE